MRKKMKKIAAFLAVLGVLYGLPIGTAQAAENEEMPEFELNQVIVTALRTEKTDLETPAAVSVLTAKDLEKTGASNLVEALQFTEGLTAYSTGAGGQSWGSMNSKIIMRGVTRGVLVMLNGTPLNMEGKYNLEDIPVETIDRVEVLKGAAATLYGSEASGGVINIITKKDFPKQASVKLEAGNYDYKKGTFNYQDGKMGLTYIREKSGERWNINKPKDTATYGYGYDGFDADRLSFAYKINDKLNLNYSYGDKSYGYFKIPWSKTNGFTGKKSELSSYDVNTNNFDLLYNDPQSKVKGALYFHNKKQDYRVDVLTTGKRKISYIEHYANGGLDLQKTWQLDEKNSLLAGINYLQNYYKYTGRINNYRIDNTEYDLTRRNYALYLQDSLQATDDLTLILGGRMQLVRQDTEKNTKYNEFTPQFQSIYKINDNASWYTNIGKVFNLPNLNALHTRDSYDDNTVKGNSDLKAEEGWSYETGWKFIKPDYSLKIALFNLRLKDSITWQTIEEHGNKYYYPINEEFKNTGLEISYVRSLNDNWSFSLGGSYSNPKTRKTGEKADNEWKRTYAKLQFTGGVNYTDERWDAALKLNVLGQRVDPDDNDLSIPNNVNLNLSVGYKLNDNNRITLNIDNLLDRENVINHKAAAYYATPFNYRLAWEFKF